MKRMMMTAKMKLKKRKAMANKYQMKMKKTVKWKHMLCKVMIMN